MSAVDTALAIDPRARPSASDLAAELRNAGRKPQARTTRVEPTVAPDQSLSPARRHARRVLPVAFGALAAALGATLLPFWPPEIVALLIVATGVACWLDPRLGLALALATPIFPLGNVAAAAATLYGVFAVGWLALNWRDARHGLWFMAGPLLAALGLLPLVPIVLIPVRSTARRAAHGILAVLATVLLAAVAGNPLPFGGGVASTLGLSPLASSVSAAAAVWTWLAGTPLVIAGAIVVGSAAALLPWAQRCSRVGVAMVGLVVTAGSVLAGAGIASTLVLMLVWGGFALAAAAPRRA